MDEGKVNGKDCNQLTIDENYDSKTITFDVCRLCARPFPGCISLYSEEGMKLNLREKICSSLPLTVEDSDTLPKTICLTCVDKLEVCFKFVQQALAAYENLLVRLEAAESDVALEEQAVKAEPEEVKSGRREDDAASTTPNTPTPASPKRYLRKNLKIKKRKKSCPSKFKKKSDETSPLRGNESILRSNTSLTSCTECGVRSGTHRENLDHWQLHHSGQPIQYACQKESCTFKTLHLSDMKGHVKEHLFQDGKIAQCDICSKYFPHKQLKAHISTVHVVERAFACTFCARRFKTQKMLQTHARQHAPEEEKYQFSCEQCGKQFIQQSNLELHLQRHQDRKPYQCDACDKGFYSVHDLKYHKYVHTGERPFQCDQCDLAFIRNGDLDKHVKTKHLHQLRFQCSFCPVKYNRKDQLRAHELGHTGETPFRCDICGRGFRRKDKLKQHLGIHLPEEDKYKYPCHLCGKRYTESGNLKVHLKSSAHQDMPR